GAGIGVAVGAGIGVAVGAGIGVAVGAGIGVAVGAGIAVAVGDTAATSTVSISDPPEHETVPNKIVKSEMHIIIVLDF
ncbi:MAG: hypothetical protein VX643_02535, partial [Chloroflexota bacterium]|nr:hypothetical protein [Chloroflexota bacterium]